MNMLPVITTPTYEIKLFSQPRPIQFRPYLVKEEKLLLMAQHGEDRKEIEGAVRQLIRNCTFDKVNPDALPTFDVEYLFLQLRAKSVNNVIEVKFKCQNLVNQQACDALVPVAINIDDIKLTVPPDHTNKIWLNDQIGVVLMYPTTTLPDAANDVYDMTTILPACLQQVFTKDGHTYEVQEQPPEDVKQFIESLTLAQVEKIRTFFDTMPHLAYTFTFTCPRCQYTDEVTLRGLLDFFD